VRVVRVGAFLLSRAWARSFFPKRGRVPFLTLVLTLAKKTNRKNLLHFAFLFANLEFAWNNESTSNADTTKLGGKKSMAIYLLVVLAGIGVAVFAYAVSEQPDREQWKEGKPAKYFS
jgi:hypothetical protein